MVEGVVVRSDGDEGVEGVGDVAGEPEVAGLGEGTGTVGIQDEGMGRTISSAA